MGGGKVRAVAVAPSVYAIEVAIRKTVEAYGDKIGKRGRKFLKQADILVDSRPFHDIAASNPVFEESAMFDRMLREMDTYKRVVFDTVAVANAVRLIGLAKIYGL